MQVENSTQNNSISQQCLQYLLYAHLYALHTLHVIHNRSVWSKACCYRKISFISIFRFLTCLCDANIWWEEVFGIRGGICRWGLKTWFIGEWLKRVGGGSFTYRPRTGGGWNWPTWCLPRLLRPLRWRYLCKDNIIKKYYQKILFFYCSFSIGLGIISTQKAEEAKIFKLVSTTMKQAM